MYGIIGIGILKEKEAMPWKAPLPPYSAGRSGKTRPPRTARRRCAKRSGMPRIFERRRTFGRFRPLPDRLFCRRADGAARRTRAHGGEIQHQKAHGEPAPLPARARLLRADLRARRLLPAARRRCAAAFGAGAVLPACARRRARDGALRQGRRHPQTRHPPAAVCGGRRQSCWRRPSCPSSRWPQRWATQILPPFTGSFRRCSA